MQRPYVLLALILLTVTGCKPGAEATIPPAPHSLSETDIAHFCNMAAIEHAGPKGQILLKSASDPVWFASIRDTVAYTLLPEEPKDIAAIYVTDMEKLTDPHHPADSSWIDARTAFYVVGSAERGAMGGAEVFPFGTEAGARRFAAAHQGDVVRYADIPRDAIFEAADHGSAEPPSAGRTIGGAS